jgi:phage terminase small subunit
MGQVQLSDRQSSFIFYLVHQGKGRTEAARLAGFAAPRQSAFNLTQSPKIIAKIRQERNKVYQTELASTAVNTLKEVMEDKDAPANSRDVLAAAILALAGASLSSITSLSVLTAVDASSV